jgi:hypothetical protein
LPLLAVEPLARKIRRAQTRLTPDGVMYHDRPKLE